MNFRISSRFAGRPQPSQASAPDENQEVPTARPPFRSATLARCLWGLVVAWLVSFAPEHSRAAALDFLTVTSNSPAMSTFSSTNGNGIITVTHVFSAGGAGPYDNKNTLIFPSQYPVLFPGSGLIQGHLANTLYGNTSTVTFDLTSYNVSPATVFGIWNITDEAVQPPYRVELVDFNNAAQPPTSFKLVGNEDNVGQQQGRNKLVLNPANGDLTANILINQGNGIHSDAAFWTNIPPGTKKINVYGRLSNIVGNTEGDGVGYYFAEPHACLHFSNEVLECLGTNQFRWSFCVTNTGTLTNGHFVFLDLPAGVTVNPRVIDLSPTLKPGQRVCTNVTFTVNTAAAGQPLCFRLAAHTPDYQDCCLVPKCLDLPACCGAIVEDHVDCSPDGSGNLQWNFVLQNRSGTVIKYLYLDADPGCITPKFQILTFNPPLTNNQWFSTNIVFASTNHCPSVCFTVSLHDPNLVNCCSFRRCLKLPDCGGVIIIPGGGPSQSANPLITNPDGPTVVQTLAPLDVPVRVLQPNVNPTSVCLLLDGHPVSERAFPTDSLILGTLMPGAYTLAAGAILPDGSMSVSPPMTLIVQTELPANQLFAQPTSQGVKLRLQTIAGQGYQVESSSSLRPDHWNLEDDLKGDGHLWERELPDASDSTRLFRLRGK